MYEMCRALYPTGDYPLGREPTSHLPCWKSHYYFSGELLPLRIPVPKLFVVFTLEFLQGVPGGFISQVPFPGCQAVGLVRGSITPQCESGPAVAEAIQLSFQGAGEQSLLVGKLSGLLNIIKLMLLQNVYEVDTFWFLFVRVTFTFDVVAVRYRVKETG